MLGGEHNICSMCRGALSHLRSSPAMCDAISVVLCDVLSPLILSHDICGMVCALACAMQRRGVFAHVVSSHFHSRPPGQCKRETPHHGSGGGMADNYQSVIMTARPRTTTKVALQWHWW